MLSNILFTLGSLAALTVAHPTRRADNATSLTCQPEFQGILSPANGAILTQNISTFSCNTFEVVYCSGQYDKTSSIDASVWLSNGGNPDPIVTGELLAKGVKPDNDGGFYSYRFNVSICPIDGEYMTGPYLFSVYETETGYYNPYNYDITSVNVTMATSGATACTTPRDGC